MIKIGEFSKLSHLTIKALRFYEKEGILMPAAIDEWSGYRYYETSQLFQAATIKAYRQLDLTIDEIKAIINGGDVKEILLHKKAMLIAEQKSIDIHLSLIKYILKEDTMNYQVSEKIIPETIVYSVETTLNNYQDMMSWIPAVGAECAKLNPNLKCVQPSYEFCEYLDGEHKEKDIRIRHNEAVMSMGIESDTIKFRILSESKVLSIYHKGAYDNIGEAYAFIMKYAETLGYKVIGLARECYIDGIWNKESVDEWLTEIQLPVE